MNRRNFLMGATASTFVACKPAIITSPKPRLAITMDDFNLNFDQVLTPLERNSKILDAFKRHNHKAAGFVTGRFVESDLGQKVVQSWSNSGHLIGNHTFTHMNSSDEDSDIIKADILKNDTLMSDYQGYEKIFRFPFLAEGGELEKIEAYRIFLKENGFQNAAVTIDSIDWYTTSRLENRLRDNPNADIRAYRDYYVKAVVELSAHFQGLAEKLGYPDLPHAMLMHHNILNGLYLDDVLMALKSEGWEFVDAREAFAHPIYKLQPKTPTRGRSLLSVLAQERGIENKTFPQAYRGFGEKTMDALGL